MAYSDTSPPSADLAVTATLLEAVRIVRPVWPLVALTSSAGAATGLAGAALVAAINQALYPATASPQLLPQFAALCLATLTGEIVGGLASARLTQEIAASLRYDLTARILDAPLIDIERLKPHRLLAILDTDVPVIGALAMQLSGIVVSLAVTLGCFGYLVALSPALSLVTLAAVLLGGMSQIASGRIGARGLDSVREAQDDLHIAYRGLTEGAKELRISQSRRVRIVEQLGSAIETTRTRFETAMRAFVLGRAASSAVFFVTLLLVIGVALALDVEVGVTSGFVLAMLYLKGPLEQLVNALPLIANAQASLRKVSQLSTGLAPIAPDRRGDATLSSNFQGSLISLKDIEFRFPPVAGSAGFLLGPIDLEIRRGETLFIVGANGSGKTTLIKLLTGLYQPSAGTVTSDGRVVEWAAIDGYRALFSAIYFDYFLFDDLVSARPSWPDDAMRYLEALEISHKVTIQGERFSTTDLSTGQRKRLALVQLLLEDRPIVVLDEWAADQDPTFRNTFYTHLLPELKRQGKTLIVVSHDDRYFGIADRIVYMTAGRLTSWQPQSQEYPVL